MGAIALLAALLLIGHQASERQGVLRLESERLATQARAIEQNLALELRGVHAALIGVRDDLGSMPANDRSRLMSLRLAALSRAMPGVLAMQLLDAQGRVQASSEPEQSRPTAAVPAPLPPRGDLPGTDLMVVSPPFEAGGMHSLQLSAVVFAADGAYAGRVSATLDPDYFNTLLNSVLYAADMWAAIVHADGTVLVESPASGRAQGMNLSTPGTMFSAHIRSGRPDTVLRGQAVATGDERLLALRTVQPAGLPMDQPLVVAVSRQVQALLVPWTRQTAEYAIACALMQAGAWLALMSLQRRGAARQRLQAAEQARAAADAERLRLALSGGDLALWDLDIVGRHCAVNERWYTMLGYRPGELSPDDEGWRVLLHPDDYERVVKLQDDHQAGLTPAFEATYRLRHREGHWIWVLDRARVVERDAQGQPLRMVGTHMDISERMQAEAALRMSEQRSRGLLEALDSGVVVHDSDGAVRSVNAAACRILGLSAEQALGQVPRDPGWSLLDEEGAPLEPGSEPAQVVLAGGEAQRFVVVGVRRADLPHPVWMLCSAFPLHDAQGALHEVVVTFSEFTERKLAEEALQRSEARLRMAGRLARLGTWRLDLPTGRLALPPEAAALIGAPVGQPLLLPEVLSLIGAVHRPGLEAALQAQLPFDIELEARSMKGATLSLRMLGEPVFDEADRVVAMQGAVQDLTSLRQDQQQLRLLQTAVGRINDVVIISEAEPLDGPGPRIVFVNPAFERLTGWQRDEVIGRSTNLLLGPKTDRAEMWRFIDALSRQQACRGEVQHRDRHGRHFWVDVEVVPLVDASGRSTHLVAVQRDIGERRRAEAAVRAAQDELAATLQAVPDLLFDIDIDGLIHGHHSPRSDLLFVPADQQLGRRVAEVLPAAAAAQVMRGLREATEHGASLGLQYELPLAQGPRWFEISVACKRVAAGEKARFILLARDITERMHGETERRKLESQLREAQKIESVGTLAGGIAHDFNNILAAILGNAALARAELSAGHPAAASLQQITTAGVRARSLVQQILTFSRRQPQALAVQALQPVLQETLALLRATLPAAVRLDTLLTAEPLLVEADATQVQQVVMNLCTNAWHALPESGGRIEVGLERGDAATGNDGPDHPSGPCVHLWVRDDGAGMDEATRARIFDPFFTTKPVGQGTGLGLSVVHGIVRAHRGVIAVDSVLGGGTTVHVHLPLAVAPAGAGDLVPAMAADSGRGQGQSVLYVDDDEVMALMVERLLQREGWRVEVFSRAADALARVLAAPMDFDIVVSDHNMPEMSGIEFATRLAQQLPALPVLISSGYITDSLRREAAAVGVRALLQKEHTLERLSALVQQVLGTASLES